MNHEIDGLINGGRLSDDADHRGSLAINAFASPWPPRSDDNEIATDQGWKKLVFFEKFLSF